MYYVSRNGVQQGPHSIEQINSLLAAGQLGGTDLAWQEGMAQWEPLSRIPGVGAAGSPPPMPGAYSPPMSNVAPQMGIAQGPPRTSGMAIASMVLGILCIILFFTHVFALIMGLLAVIFGHVSRGTIRRSRGNIGGGGMALAGLVTGYIGIVIVSIILIAAAFFVKEMLNEDSELRRKMREQNPGLEREIKDAIEKAEEEQRNRSN
jgi:hypothetical protein